MYFDQITTTTVPPDMYDYLFAFDKPSRNRIRKPVKTTTSQTTTRKKFDAQALKAAYMKLLKQAETQKKARSRVTRSLFGGVLGGVEEMAGELKSMYNNAGGVEELARQFLQRITGPGPKPRVWGLLDRRAPPAFRQNTFVKISLSQFAIVSTGTTGKKILSNLNKYHFNS